MKKSLKFVFTVFVIWRLFLLLNSIASVKFIEPQENYLGGGKSLYSENPIFWGWGNFDGEHYLSIAKSGYAPLKYFYFPLYPKAIDVISSFFGFQSDFAIVSVGLVISHIALFFALVGIYEIGKNEFNEKVSKYAVVALLAFPSSFYFAGLYTESLFLALSVWTFIFLEKKKYALSGIFAATTGASRIIGIALIPSMLIEVVKIRKKSNKYLAILIAPIGLLLYMYYLYSKTGNPIEFTQNLGIYGEQRSGTFVILPQVFYRYIFKILPVIPISYWQGAFTAYLEFITGALFTIISFFSFKSIRLGFSIYLLIGFLIPTFSGSFSSLPRYVLVLFPAFLIIGNKLSGLSNVFKFTIIGLMIVCLSIAHALFFRGYWIS